MWFAEAVLSAVVFGLAGFCMKYSSVHGYSARLLLSGLYLSGTVGFGFWAIWQGVEFTHTGEMTAGLIVGFGSVAGNYLFMKALQYGPASLTSPLVNMSILFVVLMSVLFYGELLSAREWGAISLLILSVFLLPVDPQESISIRHRVWYLLVGFSMVLFFLRNGGLKVTEELALNNTAILFYGYFFGMLWTGGAVLRKENLLKRGDRRGRRVSRRISLYSGLAAGLFSFAGMQLYVLALETGPASIVSPIFATNSLVVAMLSMWWFKERLSPLQMLALLGVMSGLILLRI